MNIPREFIDLLLARVDLVDLINAQIPLRKKSGSNYFARCPFHSEKSASFSVSQPKQFYHCFGCGAHGNAIDFMMQHERLNFPEAVEALARHVGMEIPRTSTPYQKQKDDHVAESYDLLTQVATFYYDRMRASKHAIDYLKRRGIEGNIAKQFQIGYAPNGWSNVLDTFGKTDAEKKTLLEMGLTIKKEDGSSTYDRFRDRIMFPIHDVRGRVIGFGGRVLDKGEPKYLNSPETPLFQKGHELYGLYHALKAHRSLPCLLVVEGYMDVIALVQHGITYAVATLGTATTPHHLKRMMRYTHDIIFCFDGDNAGRTAAWRAVQTIMPNMQDNLQIRFLFLPDGEDPDTIIRKEGKEAFEQRLKTALSLSEFFFQTLSREADLNTMEGRASFTAKALNDIKQLPADIFQSMMLDELSKRARADIEKLKQQIKQSQSITTESITLTQESPHTKLRLPTPARLVMALLVQHPFLVENVQDALPVSQAPWYEFLLQLIDTIKPTPTITTAALLEQWRDQKEAPFIAKLVQWEHMIPEAGLKNEFLGALRQLHLLCLDETINHLMNKASQEGLNEDEKRELASWISKKKQYSTQNPLPA